MTDNQIRSIHLILTRRAEFPQVRFEIIVMYYDIVGSLPLELLVQIVEYLDLEDIVRSQRVSIAQVKTRKLVLHTDRA